MKKLEQYLDKKNISFEHWRGTKISFNISTSSLFLSYQPLKTKQLFMYCYKNKYKITIHRNYITIFK